MALYFWRSVRVTESCSFKPPVAYVWMCEAHALLATNRTGGKIVARRRIRSGTRMRLTPARADE